MLVNRRRTVCPACGALAVGVNISSPITMAMSPSSGEALFVIERPDRCLRE
jgi:hypothetical protein